MPGFTDGWKLAKRLAADADRMDVKLPTYGPGPAGDVGARIPDHSPLTVSCFDVSYDLVSADAGTWAERDGLALVKGRKPNEDPVWVDRTALEDPRYQMTLDKIAATATDEDAELQVSFWARRRAALESAKTVRLPHAFPGVDPKSEQTVQVPAGEYPKVAVREGDFALPNSAPFFVVIRLPGVGVVGISPAALGGVASPVSADVSVATPGGPVSAAALREAFAATPAHVRQHIPDGIWLTDDQIHYVEPRVMGAAHVLERIPADAAEVTRAEQDTASSDVFVAGMSTPGLRLGAHILVLNTMFGTGTEYHEAVHQRSHEAFRRVFGRDFNEGVTEYFTRIVVTDRVARTDSPYEPQLATTQALVRTAAATEAELAAAFFAGRLAPLYAGFDRVTRGTLSFPAFVESLGARTAHIAQELLEQAARG